MVLGLFAVSFLLAVSLSIFIAWISREAIDAVLRHFIADSIVRAGFEKYLRFAIVVAGISGGTRVRALQEYVSTSNWNKAAMEAALNQETWVLELYRTVTGSLEAIAGLLLACLVLALLAPAVFRMFKAGPDKPEVSRPKSAEPAKNTVGPR